MHTSIVPGSTQLPAGYPHPHASEEARAIAERGMILRVQVGSGVHGTSIAGQDDRDEMGLCLEPPQFVTGLARVPNGTGGLGPSVRFEQYERHTAWPGRAGWRPGPVPVTWMSSSTPPASGRDWRWPGTPPCCSSPTTRLSTATRRAPSWPPTPTGSCPGWPPPATWAT